MPDEEPKSIPAVLADLWDLLKTYAKQEAVDPLKAVPRFLALGVASSILLGLGIVLLSLAGLRALQTETGSTFTGNWSWAPYLVTFGAAVVVVVIAVSRIGAKRKGN